ncbi:MAG TPA: hypothetical protein ENI61_04535 [Ignavibacteria bacterium]|nr:hypothetical protein [Ignavibacteria bacterium]
MIYREDKTNKKITVKKRTWFGVEGVVEISQNFFHKAGIGKVIIPHPPVVNRLLRLGLNRDDKNSLSITHEFGHLQTFPQLVIYFLLISYLAVIQGGTSWLEIVLLLISIHSVWEIMAELFTITSSGYQYRLFYKEVSVIPRIIFWTITILFSIGGWVLLFR